MKYALLFLAFLTQTALACEVYLPYQMIIFSNDKSGVNVYQAKNCEAKVTDDLHQIVTELEGRIASFQLKEMMAARGHNIEVQPQSVLIQQFRTMIRDQLLLPVG
ncbi:MAG: hypothetical protein H0V66_10440, partial [Bdellovibrionales bacterium]|nr:hypothetical protein [Bdellovibrionales bacterium]